MALRFAAFLISFVFRLLSLSFFFVRGVLLCMCLHLLISEQRIGQDFGHEVIKSGATRVDEGHAEVAAEELLSGQLYVKVFQLLFQLD